MNVDVVCGVIWCGNKILAARKKEGKSHPFLWELPGGKVERGESHEDSLRRELWEELSLQVAVGAKLGKYEYKDHVKTINLIAYHARPLRIGDNCDLRLVDHDRVEWVEVWRLFSLQWAPADIPLIEMLQRFPNNPFE